MPPEPGEVGLVEPHDFVHAQPFTFESGQIAARLHPAVRDLRPAQRRPRQHGPRSAMRSAATTIAPASTPSPTPSPAGGTISSGPARRSTRTAFSSSAPTSSAAARARAGPSSIDPRTGRPFGLAFPFVTIRDMVRAQKLLCDHLGLTSLYAVIGGSMGGMQVLQWGIEYPGLRPAPDPAGHDRARKRPGHRLQRGRPPGDHAGSRSGNDGDYPKGGGPRVGLAVARMMAHITYLSDESMDQKFGRRRAGAAGQPRVHLRRAVRGRELPAPPGRELHQPF